MKKVYKTLAVTTAFLVGSTFAFAQTLKSTDINEVKKSGISLSNKSICVEGELEVISIMDRTSQKGKDCIEVPTQGLYIVKYILDGKVKVEKVIVK
jgi:hypothetical protein